MATPTKGATVAAAPAQADLMCSAAAEVLAKYSLGVTRIPLTEVGVSPLNRNGQPISGIYVHKLFRRIFEREGFARYRYRQGWCHEPNPDDPLEVARHTNSFAELDDRLAQVEMKALYGGLAKCHLFMGLLAFLKGDTTWNDSGEPFKPPEDAVVLLDHLERGMWFEVLSFDAVKHHKAEVLALMASDNFDAALAKAEDEMALAASCFSTMRSAVPGVGETQWAVVSREMNKLSGGLWTETDMANRFNFCKVVGPEQMASLDKFHAMFVDPQSMAVRPKDFARVAKLHPRHPWLKAVLLVAQSP